MKLVLGAVQFGADYGVTNISGRPPQSAVFEALDKAYESGIWTLDSAQGYGDANQVIAEYHAVRPHRFKVINKILRFPVQSDNELESLLVKLKTELKAMDVGAFECVMLHYAPSVNSYVDNLFLQDLKKAGIAKKVGLSIDVISEYDLLSSRFDFDCIQLPFNVMNQKLIPESFLKSIHDQQIEIHVRSAFLQGAIVSDPAFLPDYLADLRPLVQAFQDDMAAIGLSPIEGALAFLHEQPFIDSVVVGVQNIEQLNEVHGAFSKVKAMNKTPDFNWEKYATDREELVRPLIWLDMEKKRNASSTR